jgi:hypothetical protein
MAGELFYHWRCTPIRQFYANSCKKQYNIITAKGVASAIPFCYMTIPIILTNRIKNDDLGLAVLLTSTNKHF